jgi:hypothetical protein
MAKNKISQEEKDFEVEVIEMYRYENSKFPDEEIDTWRKRTQHLDKMTLMYNMSLMLEGNTNASEVREHAQARYTYYKDLYDRHEYE